MEREERVSYLPAIGEPWDDLEIVNQTLDLDIKLAAIKVSKSVVALVSQSGDCNLFACSGTIVESIQSAEVDYKFINTIFTSATLVRCPSGKPCLARDVKVDVYLLDGTFYIGEVTDFDFHYNLAVVKIISDSPLPVATLRHLNISLPIAPNVHEFGTFGLRCHCDSSASFPDEFPLLPGDEIIILGRSRFHSTLVVETGIFHVDKCDFDCQELFMATSKAIDIHIGGPVINCNGEVIGISFYHPGYTPFLPMNIASRCLEQLKKNQRVHRPWVGVEVTNLYACNVATLERLIKKFPHDNEGVMVEKVKEGSPAYHDGVKLNDVIVQLHGQAVGSSLEFFELIWDNIDKTVEIVVLRKSTGERLKLFVTIDETISDNYNRWPLPNPMLQAHYQMRVAREEMVRMRLE